MLLAVRRCVLALAALACAAAATEAQQWPSQTVRVVVPYAAGGVPDIVARSLTPRLSEKFGRQFIVENKAGGSGIVAVQDVLKSPADGHQLLLSDIQQLAINPYLLTNLPYDPGKDFAPVTLAATVPLYIAARTSLGVSSFTDLVALAKSKPGALTYGSSGRGSIHHIAMEVLKAELGLDIVHVPYRGAAQSVPGFIAGDVSLVVSALPSLAPFVETGDVKLLAVSTLKRSPKTPDVQAISELIPGFDFSSEMGMVVRAGTPAEIVSALSSEIVNGLKDPREAERLNASGLVLIGSSPAGYADNIKTNLEKFERAIRISGLKGSGG